MWIRKLNLKIKPVRFNLLGDFTRSARGGPLGEMPLPLSRFISAARFSVINKSGCHYTVQKYRDNNDDATDNP